MFGPANLRRGVDRMGHNPTGYVMQLERRKEVYAVCSKYDVIILEDDPYWILQFPSAEIEEAKSRGLPIPEVKRQSLPKTSGYPFLDSLAPSFLNIDVDGRVIRLDTFSKTVAPGCRLGWVTAQPAFIDKIVR
jgi:DNA-binding transcriptional MocR family regulator